MPNASLAVRRDGRVGGLALCAVLLSDHPDSPFSSPTIVLPYGALARAPPRDGRRKCKAGMCNCDQYRRLIINSHKPAPTNNTVSWRSDSRRWARDPCEFRNVGSDSVHQVLPGRAELAQRPSRPGKAREDRSRGWRYPTSRRCFFG